MVIEFDGRFVLVRGDDAKGYTHEHREGHRADGKLQRHRQAFQEDIGDRAAILDRGAQVAGEQAGLA